MKQTGNKSWKRIALGTLAALVLYLALTALLALLIVRGTAGEAVVGVCVCAFACAAVFAGVRLASRKSGEALAPIALSALAFWALVQLLGFLANDTLKPERSAALALAAAVGGALAYLPRPVKGKGKRGKRGRRSRK